MKSDWTTGRIDHLATVKARIGWKALTAAEYQSDGYCFLSTPNIKSENIDFVNVNYINEFRYQESPELQLRVGDVLLAKDGSTLGIANVVRTLPRPATVNGSIAVIRPVGINPRFLMYVLRCDTTQSWIQQVKDGMGVPHLFQSDIRKLTFPYPTVQEEQHRIADFLDRQVARIDSIISAREVQAQLLVSEALAVNEAMYSTMSSARRRPLATLTDPSRPIQYGIVLPGPHFDGGIPIVKGGDIASGRLRRAELNCTDPAIEAKYPRSRLRPGDFVMAIRGSVGEVDEVPDGLDGANLTQDTARIAPSGCPPLWLRMALELYSVQSDIRSRITGATIPGINIEALRGVLIPDVPVHQREQLGQNAHQVLYAASSIVEALERSSALNTELKRSLITAAVTGEFDVASSDGSRVAV